MADWRNVGNWHWKERNCLEWAKKYLDEQLTGVEVSKDGFNAKIDSVDSITGDVDLNIRKGRLIAIYDVEVKLSWAATKGDDKLSGKITIPEVAHDTDDYVYDITANNSSSSMLPLKDFVRKQLTPAITSKLEGFTEELKKQNGTDMYIPDKNGKVSVSSASSSNTQLAGGDSKPTAANVAVTDSDVGVASTKDNTFSTVSISQNAEFVCSAQDMFATLTDPQRVAIWTRAPANIQAKEGAEFKLFNGHIEGKMTKLEPGKSIEQTWRVATWPKEHYSKVKIDLDQQSSSTRLTLKQTGVPFNEEDATKANWERYYWNSIKGSFGTNRLPFTYPPYTKTTTSATVNSSYLSDFSGLAKSLQTATSAASELNAERDQRKARRQSRKQRRAADSNSAIPTATTVAVGIFSVVVAGIAAVYYHGKL
ncbi:Co-chaperone [Coemansia sp. IMI 203386]|nr:Co-chaperone [Coemansia sp. IMI 203386]